MRKIIANVILQITTELDVINTTIFYAANRRTRNTETLKLIEAIIYYATVERETVVLKVGICTLHLSFISRTTVICCQLFQFLPLRC